MMDSELLRKTSDFALCYAKSQISGYFGLITNCSYSPAKIFRYIFKWELKHRTNRMKQISKLKIFEETVNQITKHNLELIRKFGCERKYEQHSLSESYEFIPLFRIIKTLESQLSVMDSRESKKKTLFETFEESLEDDDEFEQIMDTIDKVRMLYRKVDKLEEKQTTLLEYISKMADIEHNDYGIHSRLGSGWDDNEKSTKNLDIQRSSDKDLVLKNYQEDINKMRQDILNLKQKLDAVSGSFSSLKNINSRFSDEFEAQVRVVFMKLIRDAQTKLKNMVTSDQKVQENKSEKQII